MTAAIAAQQEAARRPLGFGSLVGQGPGDVGCNLSFNLASAFLPYYYTDVVGVSAAAIGIMFFGCSTPVSPTPFSVYRVGYYTVLGATVHYAQYIPGPGLAFPTGAQTLSTPFIPVLIARFGKKNCFRYCGLFTAVDGIDLFLTPTASSGRRCSAWAARHRHVIDQHGDVRVRRMHIGGTAPKAPRTRFSRSSVSSPGPRAEQPGHGRQSTATFQRRPTIANPVRPESTLVVIKVVFALVPVATAIIAMIIFYSHPLTDQRFRDIRDESEGRQATLDSAVLGEGRTS